MSLQAHRDLLTTCLRSLRQDPAAARYELLSGGISGASTYRVDLGNESIVVKIADAASSQAVLERARREESFYLLLAGRLPLRVPAVLGFAENGPDHWLCLRAYDPAPPIHAWSRDQYVEIARQLGRFHGLFWDRAQDLSRLPWLRQHDRPPTASDLQRAVEAWRALAARPRLQTVLHSHQIAWIQRMVWRVNRLEPALRDFPATLCHGDCHHANLLVDEDGCWRWADWQEVGIGRGPEDLSFFFQRARMAGGAVPDNEAVAAYHESLQAAVGRGVDLSAVRRVVAVTELRTLLVSWPHFLSGMSAEQMEDFLYRLQRLAADLGVA